MNNSMSHAAVVIKYEYAEQICKELGFKIKKDIFDFHIHNDSHPTFAEDTQIASFDSVVSMLSWLNGVKQGIQWTTLNITFPGKNA